MDRTYLTTQSSEEIIIDSFQSLERLSAAPATAGPAPAERESSDDDAGTVDLETPMSKRYFPRDPVEFYIGAPIGESFRRERPEEFFIGTPTPGTYGTSYQDGWGDDDEVSGVLEKPVVERAPPNDEISGITERSVPKRPARPDGEIPGVTGKSEDERANPDENLGWERSVSRMCVDHYGSVEGEMSVKFCIGSPANVGVLAGRPEEFFIGTPTPGDPETPPRAALEDQWVMRCIGKPADETMGESDFRGLADHLGDIRLLIKAAVDESFVRGRPEEFFIGTPTPGTLRTPSIWQGAGETLTCDSLHGVRDSGCEMQLSSMSAEVGPVSSVFEL